MFTFLAFFIIQIVGVFSLDNSTICALLTPDLLETPCVYLNNSDPCPDGLICRYVNATVYSGPTNLRCSCQDPCPALGSTSAGPSGVSIECAYNNITEPECPEGYVLDNAKSGVFKDIGGGGCQCKCPTLKTNFGIYCAAGDVGPRPCTEGFYCPTPSQRIPCPQGFFCRFGTKTPTPCPIFSYCPEGTPRAVLNATGIALNLIIIILVYLLHWRSKMKEKKKTLEANLGASTLGFHHSTLELVSSSIRLVSTSTFQTFFDLNSATGLLKKIKGFPELSFRIDLRVFNLRLELKSGVPVLHNVTAEFPSGTITAILGPSGAGKTSCMSAIIGKARAIGKISGEIMVNDIPQEEGLARFKNILGYIPQDDILHNSLTVRENIWYAILLRQNKKPEKELLELLDSILEVLELTHVANTRVGSPEKRGISGGERRRVSIGIVLAATPVLLFGDEITSGLDATTARTIMFIFHRLAMNGVNIILTLHQPRYEIFSLLDNLLLLGAGGTTVYSGPGDKALAYFESLGYKIEPHVNPADFILDCISGYYTPRIDLPGMWNRRQTDYLVTNTGLIETIRRQAKSTPSKRVRRAETNVISRSETESTINKLSLDDNDTTLSPYTGDTDPTEDISSGSPAPESTELLPPSISTPNIDPNSPSSSGDGLAPSESEMAEFDSQFSQFSHVSSSADLFRKSSDIQGRPGRSSSASSSVSSNSHQRRRSSSGMRKYSSSSTDSQWGDLSEVGNLDLRTLPRSRTNSLHFSKTDARYSDPPGIHEYVDKISWVPRWYFNYAILRFYQNFYLHRRGFWFQLWTFYKRGMLEQWRNRAGIATDFLLVFFAGAVIGLFYSYVYLPDYLSATFAVTMTVGLTGVLPATRTFTDNQVIFWREASNGINRPAFYLGQLLVQMFPPMIFSPLIFLTSFYALYQPRTSLLDMYVAVLFVQWAVFGIGYFVSLLTKPQQAILASATVVLISIMISGNSPSLSEIEQLGPIAVIFSSLSYARWAMELLVLMELKSYMIQTGQDISPPPVEVQAILSSRSYEFGNETYCFLSLFGLGLGLRILGFFALRLNHRKRQA